MDNDIPVYGNLAILRKKQKNNFDTIIFRARHVFESIPGFNVFSQYSDDMYNTGMSHTYPMHHDAAILCVCTSARATCNESLYLHYYELTLYNRQLHP